MSVLEFEQGRCKRIRVYLNSYVNDEVLTEIRHEVRRHIDNCGSCTAELEQKTRIKLRRQESVRRDSALGERTERGISKADSPRRTRPTQAMQWVLAAAAVLVLAVGGWSMLRSSKAVRPQHRSTEATLLRPEIPNAGLLNIGLADHINCAVGHRQDRPLTAGKARESLGSYYAGLVPVVKEQAPGFEIVAAHRCHLEAREFVHVFLKNQERDCSLVITKTDGESFPTGDSEPVAQAASVATYRARTRDYEVTGFETRDFLGFVVSNLSTSENRMLASSLAPAVSEFLQKLEV